MLIDIAIITNHFASLVVVSCCAIVQKSLLIMIISFHDHFCAKPAMMIACAGGAVDTHLVGGCLTLPIWSGKHFLCVSGLYLIS